MKLRKIFKIAGIEYSKWVLNARMLLFVLIFPVVKMLAVDPLVSRSVSEGMKMNVFEPLIDLCNSRLLVLIIPSFFLVMMSDFPSVEPNSMLYVSRSGRFAWMWGQVLFSLMASLTFIAVIYGGVLIMSVKNCYFGNEWSFVTRTYLSRHPEAVSSYALQLLPSNLYNQLSISGALLFSFTLLLMFFMMVSMLLMAFTVLGKRKAGLLFTVLFFLMGVITCSVGSGIRWSFPVAHFVIWVHFEEIVRKPVYAIWKSYAYFGTIMAVALLISGIMINRTGFEEKESYL